VSTAKQGKSGLGMDAQREAIERFAAGGIEVETGKGSFHKASYRKSAALKRQKPRIAPGLHAPRVIQGGGCGRVPRRKAGSLSTQAFIMRRPKMASTHAGATIAKVPPQPLRACL
jgi:hypothetical protein